MEKPIFSVNDLFYGQREAVQILKDENRDILEIIHRFNYFYTEPLSDVDLNSDSEEEDLESNWSEVGHSGRQDSVGGKKLVLVNSLANSHTNSPASSFASTPTRSLASSSFSSSEGQTSFTDQRGDQPQKEGAKVAVKVPVCTCAECEKTVTVALKNVVDNQSVTGSQSSGKVHSILTLVGICIVGAIIMVATVGLHI